MRKVKVAAAFLCLLASGTLGGIAYQGSDVSVEYADRSAILLELTDESAVTTTSIETTAAAGTTATTAAPRLAAVTARTTALTSAATTTTSAATSETSMTTSETAPATTVLQTEFAVPAVTTAEPVRLQPVTSVPREAAPEMPVTSVTEPQVLPDVTEPEIPPVSETAGQNYAISVTDREYIMLCNVVGHEYGADWVPTAEKALIAECIMNRVASPLFPNTVYDVLMQPGQFAGIEHLILMETMSSYVTQDVRDAVDLYLTHPEQFQHGYLFFSGDGYHSYFRTSY